MHLLPLGTMPLSAFLGFFSQATGQEGIEAFTLSWYSEVLEHGKFPLQFFGYIPSEEGTRA